MTEKDFQFYSDKKNKIDDNFLNLNKIETKNSNTDFFNGKFLCNNDELIVSKSYNFFFNRVNLDYERIKVRIYNKSNSLWDINNFKNQNPISIRSYLKNSKNNSTIAGVDLSHKKMKINNNDYQEFFINFNDLIKIKSFIHNNKNFDQLIFSLVREGDRWFPEDKFKTCKINLKRN